MKQSVDALDAARTQCLLKLVNYFDVIHLDYQGYRNLRLNQGLGKSQVDRAVKALLATAEIVVDATAAGTVRLRPAKRPEVA
jgi:hypothetical protein